MTETSDKRLESWRKPDWDTFGVDEGGVVIVAGRQVPHLRCHRIMHEFEGFRFHVGEGSGGETIDCSIDDAPHIASILANAIAVGAGYVCWPDEGGDFCLRPFGSRVHHVGGVE